MSGETSCKMLNFTFFEHFLIVEFLEKIVVRVLSGKIAAEELRQLVILNDTSFWDDSINQSSIVVFRSFIVSDALLVGKVEVLFAGYREVSLLIRYPSLAIQIRVVCSIAEKISRQGFEEFSSFSLFFVMTFLVCDDFLLLYADFTCFVTLAGLTKLLGESSLHDIVANLSASPRDVFISEINVVVVHPLQRCVGKLNSLHFSHSISKVTLGSV